MKNPRINPFLLSIVGGTVGFSVLAMIFGLLEVGWWVGFGLVLLMTSLLVLISILNTPPEGPLV